MKSNFFEYLSEKRRQTYPAAFSGKPQIFGFPVAARVLGIFKLSPSHQTVTSCYILWDMKILDNFSTQKQSKKHPSDPIWRADPRHGHFRKLPSGRLSWPWHWLRLLELTVSMFASYVLKNRSERTWLWLETLGADRVPGLLTPWRVPEPKGEPLRFNFWVSRQALWSIWGAEIWATRRRNGKGREAETIPFST